MRVDAYALRRSFAVAEINGKGQHPSEQFASDVCQLTENRFQRVSAAEKIHQQPELAAVGNERLADEQFVQLGAQLPMHGVERVAGAVFSNIMLLREAAAMLGTQSLARCFAVRQLGKGNRAFRTRQQQDVTVSRSRQTAEE